VGERNVDELGDDCESVIGKIGKTTEQEDHVNTELVPIDIWTLQLESL